MHLFAQILHQIPTGEASSSNNHSVGTTPFKVEVKFEIPIFKGKINVDMIDRLLNLLEAYFSIHDFSNLENITFFTRQIRPTCQGLVGNLL